MNRNKLLLLFFIVPLINFSNSMEKPDSLKDLVASNIVRIGTNYQTSLLPIELIELLDRKKVDLNKKLKMAILSGQREKMQSLLAQGACQNIKKSFRILGRDLFCHWNLQFVNFLLENGADINIRLKNGNTLLMEAIDLGNWKIMEFLIDNGININAQDKDGKTALMRLIIQANSYTHEPFFGKKEY